jgi:hypothetical protein
MRDGDCCQLCPTVEMTRYSKIEQRGALCWIEVARRSLLKIEGTGPMQSHTRNPPGRKLVDHGDSLLVRTERWER